MPNTETLKASTVLAAMVAGLKRSKNDPYFRLDNSIGDVVGLGMSYGHISTLTLTEMFGQGRLASELMFQFIGYEYSLAEHAQRTRYLNFYRADIVEVLLFRGLNLKDLLHNGLIFNPSMYDPKLEYLKNLPIYDGDNKDCPIYKIKRFRDEIGCASFGCVSWLIRYLEMNPNSRDEVTAHRDPSDGDPGSPWQLIEVNPAHTVFDHRWDLKEDNWEEQIPAVESTIVEMIAVGL
jgi:hypothetical protein